MGSKGGAGGSQEGQGTQAPADISNSLRAIKQQLKNEIKASHDELNSKISELSTNLDTSSLEITKKINERFDDVVEIVESLSSRVEGNEKEVSVMKSKVSDHENRISALESHKGQDPSSVTDAFKGILRRQREYNQTEDSWPMKLVVGRKRSTRGNGLEQMQVDGPPPKMDQSEADNIKVILGGSNADSLTAFTRGSICLLDGPSQILFQILRKRWDSFWVMRDLPQSHRYANKNAVEFAKRVSQTANGAHWKIINGCVIVGDVPVAPIIGIPPQKDWPVEAIVNALRSTSPPATRAHDPLSQISEACAKIIVDSYF